MESETLEEEAVIKIVMTSVLSVLQLMVRLNIPP
jgi:hypothetical protein